MSKSLLRNMSACLILFDAALTKEAVLVENIFTKELNE